MNLHILQLHDGWSSLQVEGMAFVLRLHRLEDGVLEILGPILLPLWLGNFPALEFRGSRKLHTNVVDHIGSLVTLLFIRFERLQRLQDLREGGGARKSERLQANELLADIRNEI